MYNSEGLNDARRLPPPERNMTVMPLDVRQAKFPTAMRGYDREEVTSFLEQAAEGFEMALRDNDRLRQEIARLEGALSQFRDLEGSLKNTLMSAQRLADDMKENAAQESTRIVREAEGRAEMSLREAESRAEMILQKALAKLEDVQREIDGLRMRRREAESGIESLISALGHTLTFVREQDRDRQDKVVPHRRLEAAPVVPEPPAALLQPEPPSIIQSA